MRKRSTKRKTIDPDLLVSPLLATTPTPGSPIKSGSESPKEFEFNFNTTKLTSSSSKKNNNCSGDGGGAPASIFMKRSGGSSSSSPLKGISSISDLKELAASRMESIKRQLERSHSEIIKDSDASQSRLQKRFKIQTQRCQQVLDEEEKEHKKLYDHIAESQEAMKASFTEFMAEAQASASRLCKTSIPEISQSFEKSINFLSSRYGISSTST